MKPIQRKDLRDFNNFQNINSFFDKQETLKIRQFWRSQFHKKDITCSKWNSLYHSNQKLETNFFQNKTKTLKNTKSKPKRKL